VNFDEIRLPLCAVGERVGCRPVRSRLGRPAPLNDPRQVLPISTARLGWRLIRRMRHIGAILRRDLQSAQRRTAVRASIRRRTRPLVSLSRAIPAPEPGAGMVRPSGKWSSLSGEGRGTVDCGGPTFLFARGRPVRLRRAWRRWS
jgi:hypothetical protein